MGFIDYSTDPKLLMFYNVVRAVGKQCPNVCDDVKLVQYLLKAFYETVCSYDRVFTRPQGSMTVDGICGPVTLNWILKFQLDLNTRNPGTLAADNRVDRVRNKNFIGSFTQTVYTLAQLNLFVKTVNPAAFMATPTVVPLQSAATVPPPTADVVAPQAAAALKTQKAIDYISDQRGKIMPR